MFSQEEMQASADEAIASLPLSVSAGPEKLTDDQKKLFRGILIAVLKVVFTAVTKIPLPVQQAPGLPGAESLMVVPDLTAVFLKPALSFVAQTYGDAIVAAILSQKDEVDKFVGDPVFDLAERIIRELRGSQFASY